MGCFRNDRGLRGRAIVAALGLISVVGFSALGDEPAGKGEKTQTKAEPGPGPAVTPEEQREARDIFKALRDLNESLQQEGQVAKKATSAAKLPTRPARTIKPPTLDSAGIDALVEKSLAEAKVPPPA